MAAAGVDITIGGKPYWSASTYSITEDSTALDPSDSIGGYGQLSLTLRDSPELKAISGKEVLFTDGAQGQTSGIARGSSSNGLSAQITADSRLALTTVIRTAAPFAGTLGEALRYYLSLCGVTTNIVIHEDIENVPVVVPGWKAVVYDQLKKFAAARGFEFTLASRNIVFRPPRGRVAINHRDASVTWTVADSDRAQTVEGYFYSSVYGTDIAYPSGGWNEDVDIYTVDAGETVEIDLEISASLSSVEQPTCVKFVDRHHASTSVYSVTGGGDNLPIEPEQWLDGGGSLTVAIGEDTRSLKITIRGAVETEYAPYRIAVSAGASSDYSSLRIRGTGVFMDEQLVSLPATTDTDQAPEEIGATVENEFFETSDQLHHALLRSAARYGGPRRTISVQSKGINRRGETGSYVYPTIGDLKALYPGATIGDLKAELGPTIADWNATLFATVQDDFENQAFGNVAGARVRHEDSWYRIRSATIAPGGVGYSAEQDNTIGDVFRTGETIGEWNARWAGKTIGDVNAAPLWQPDLDPDPIVPPIVPSLTLFPSETLYPES